MSASQKHILVVGCGSIGQRHARCFLKTARAQVAVCDTNSTMLKKARQEYDVASFESLQQAFAAQQFDGVVICTPAHTHIEIAMAALRRASALLIEKPLSVASKGIDELKLEMAKSNAFVRVAYVYHFMTALREARQILQSGAFGKPLQVSVVAGQNFASLRPSYREIYYAHHETGGGAIQDALTHLFNAVEWLIGPSTKIFCEAAHQSLEGVTVEDTVCVTAKNGTAIVSYSLNQFQWPNETAIQIHCERGSVKIEIHNQRWAIFSHASRNWEYHPAPVAQPDDAFVAQANAFLDGLEGKPNLLCTLDEAIQTLKCNVAALQSTRTGIAVPIV